MYGLSSQSLLFDGRVVPSAIVLSHPEQLSRLRDAVPEAGANAVVAGDPRFDRMLASGGLRGRYRRALGVPDGVELVVVSSTWWSRSLFGSWPDLLRQLMAELPVDRYRVAAILHPHVWHGHSALQARLWLADCLRAGLILVPPAEGWAATLIAADLVIGDHGAVTCYGAALDKPVLLAAFPREDVAPESSVDLLGVLAPVLDPGGSLLSQVDSAMSGHLPGQYGKVAELVSSVPGEAAVRLREVCYGLLGLDGPETPVVVPLLPNPQVTAGVWAVRASGAVLAGGEVVVARFPADVLSGRRFPRPALADAHLVAHAEHPMPAVRTSADVVFVYRADVEGDPVQWTRDALVSHPFCLMAAVVLDGGGCVVSVRNGPTLAVARHADSLWADPLVAVSALYLRMAADLADPPAQLRIQLGDNRFADFAVTSSECCG